HDRANGSLQAAAEESATVAVDRVDRVDQELREQMHGAILLREESAAQLSASMPAAERSGAESAAAFGKLWLVGALLARGDVEKALPWVGSLAAHGAAHSNRWRIAEADELRRACQVTRAGLEPCAHDVEADPAGRGYIAEWLHAGVQAYQGVYFRGAASAELPPAWEWASTHMPAGYRTAGDGFRAALAAHRDDRWVGQPAPPAALTLLNAGHALATAEAAAISGTQAVANAWASWFAERWPAWMQTTAEWPASALRVQGLVQARSGDLRTAVALLKQATTWCERAGYVVEHAISMVQLAELMALAPGTVQRRVWIDIRSAGREQCRVLGIDSAAVADAAVSAAALGKFDAQRPQLTPREVEVLDLFRGGLTYRQVGDELHLDWRTVQTHAKNIYAKLEVNSKTGAVVRAGELGLL
ncbi:MAG: LuxR C-terminal-related transcriptional regulator, partial [Dehalococcoidia bacterium]